MSERTPLQEAEELGLLLLEPRSLYDRCLVAVVRGPDDSWASVRDPEAPCAQYSMAQCIEVLMDSEGWSYDEALDWFDFNVSGGWVGQSTPTFRDDLDSL